MKKRIVHLHYRLIKKMFIIILFSSLLVPASLFPASPTGRADSDYELHVKELQKKIPPGFTIIIEKPFVVIGDEKPERVNYHAVHTVRWAVTRLKTMYFTKDPENIIDIWLFKNAESYRKYTWEIFGHHPHTPFGYSSPAHNALVMNIATGGGTLVHEIVHPFMAANFPACPAWFNEGLGSLYEQCKSKGENEITGLTNWRLPALKEAIRKKELPSFKKMTGTTDEEFYKYDPGTNYAQARYLCYYLQEKGCLIRFYQTFQANCKQDPTGYETLRQVLGVTDMAAFQKEWERFVLGLVF